MSLNNTDGEQSVNVDLLEQNAALSAKGSKKWIGAAAAVAVVAGLAVGGMALVNVLGGGGVQPESVLPANAIAFAKLDLDPPAAQKVAAYRLASKFPQSKDKVTSEETSVKESVIGSLFTGDSGLGLDYKKDVEPWLGKRIGVGVFPDMDADNRPEIGLAIAFTDEGAVKAALDKAIAKATNKQDKIGYAFAGDYVIVSDTTANAMALAAEGKGSALAAAGSRYAEDVQRLGSDQIALAWVDIAAAYKAVPNDLLADRGFGMLKGANDPKDFSGRFVVGLHAESSFLELSGKGVDIKGAGWLVKDDAGTEGGMITSFPADVFGAVTATGLGKAVGAFYTSLSASGDEMEIKPMLEGTGIGSAKQIETLLGAETGVVVGGTIDQPEFAVRTRGGDPAAAFELARELLGSAQLDTGEVTVHKVNDPTGIAVGMGSGLMGAITSQSGSKLGSTETFKQVMPGADQADFAAYLNLARLMPLRPRTTPRTRPR
jgi:hypothetical protein